MKLKCDDGIVREFTICRSDYSYDIRRAWNESECLECGKSFGVHDTHILKPLWKKHVCSKKLD